MNPPKLTDLAIIQCIKWRVEPTITYYKFLVAIMKVKRFRGYRLKAPETEPYHYRRSTDKAVIYSYYPHGGSFIRSYYAPGWRIKVAKRRNKEVVFIAITSDTRTLRMSHFEGRVYVVEMSGNNREFTYFEYKKFIDLERYVRAIESVF